MSELRENIKNVARPPRERITLNVRRELYSEPRRKQLLVMWCLEGLAHKGMTKRKAEKRKPDTYLLQKPTAAF